MLCWVVTGHNLFFGHLNLKGIRWTWNILPMGLLWDNDHLLLTSQSKVHDEIDIAYANWVDVAQGPQILASQSKVHKIDVA
jgi:hypothetical protein